ncbi:MAG: hypothetical protein Tsb0034_17060 [Ekhidna sp.]
MKNQFLAVLLAFVILSCDDVITVELPEADALVAVDAWLYHEAEPQEIELYRTNTYFDTSVPLGIGGATVTVTDLATNRVYNFTEGENGSYEWTPATATDTFGIIGNEYLLSVQLQDRELQSVSRLNRVVPIDSITWRLEESNFFDDAYFGEFWATDAVGEGDTYWIKTWKNGIQLTKPAEVNLAWDGGFSEGDNADGITFIRPVRDGINPFDTDDNDELISPYELGDSVYVEITSITQEAHFFLNSVITQTDRQDGFGELFATPLANVQSNIFSTVSTEKVVGFFCISATSGLGRVFTEDAIIEVPE